MKKTLIAFGAALACMGAAHAQSNVQLTGLIDTFVGSMKAPGGERTSKLDAGGMTTSYWGVSGTEDLGNGLKAGFALESFFRGDEGAPGRFGTDNFFARNAHVSLSGGFGTLKLGRSMAPNFLPTILFNPLGDSFVVSPLVLHANMHWGTVPGVNNAFTTYRTTAADTGWSNQITYTTPNFNGLSANLHYQFGEQAGDSGKRNVGANVLFFKGPLALTAFYESADISNPSPSLLPYSKDNWMVGGSYNFGPVKFFATYGESETKDTTALVYEAETISLGLDIPVSKSGAFKVAAAQTKVEPGWVGDLKRSTASVGYDHFLSKRTDAYAAVMYDKLKANSSSESGTSVAVGVRHRF